MLAGFGTADPANAQRATLDRMVRRDTLPNGMAVIVVENHNTPLATLQVTFRGGAMTQTEDTQGVPHLFEHMLFKAYGGRGRMPFGYALAEIKGSYNGTTTDETVNYFVTVPADKVRDGLDLLAGLVRDPEFTDDHLRTERFIVRGELQRHASEPADQLSDEMRRLLWREYYPRKNIGGDDLSLFAGKKKQLEEIFRAYYVPNVAALIVTGDVVADRVLAQARDKFGGWRRKPDPFVTTPIPDPLPLDSTRAVVIAGDVKAVTIELTWRGPDSKRELAQSHDADLLAQLANDPDSPFQKRLVDRGLFQSARIGFSGRSKGSSIRFVGVARPDSVANALAALNAELRGISDSGYFDEAALRVAKKRRQVETAFAFEQTSGLAYELADWWAGYGIETYVDWNDAIAKRSRSDVAATVTQFMASKPFVVGALAPEKHSQLIARWIGQFVDISSFR
jgi:zinc protease